MFLESIFFTYFDDLIQRLLFLCMCIVFVLMYVPYSHVYVCFTALDINDKFTDYVKY